MFAAAGNWGLNRPRAFPARQNGVFCVYASDGNGYRDNVDPKNEGNCSFTTLGVAVPSKWRQEDIYVTGTSYATPIAGVIAASILEFARRKMHLGDFHWRLLTSYQGMRKVFELLSASGEHHKYVSLGQLGVKGHKTSDQIKGALQDALDLG